MLPSPVTALSVGDIVPQWSLNRRSGQPFDLNADEEAGHVHVLIFVADQASTPGRTVIEGFARRRDDLDTYGARVRLVLSTELMEDPAFPVLIDPDGAASRLAGLTTAMGKVAGSDFSVLVVAPNHHLAAHIGPDSGDAAGATIQVIRALAERRKAAGVPAIHPPVLVVPDVLSPADCKRLIGIYAMQGQEFVDPGHNQLKGRTTDCKMRIPEYGRNDRIDHWVCSAANNSVIDARLVPRLMPEIQKAFQYKVTRHERYRIACYEGYRGGSQHGHRDNTLPFVAHRRFAVTINLNSEEYEGAELRFPEFSEAAYKTPTGSAIVFSCSLLHEVMAMRSGRRFALLAFLFGET